MRQRVDIDDLVEVFHNRHEKLHGSREPGSFVEFINWRVKAVGLTIRPEFKPPHGRANQSLSEAISGKREAFFKNRGNVDTIVYQGRNLEPWYRINGPAIIEEAETTIMVFPGTDLVVTPYLNYRIRFEDTFRFDGNLEHRQLA